MKLKYLYIWLIGLLAIGCFDDDTTVDTVRISEVAIDTNSLQKEYNRDKNQTLVIDITSYVTQKEKDLPLTFQWDMDYKFYSGRGCFHSCVRWLMEAWGILKCVACQRITTELYSRNHPRICRKDYPNYLSVIKMIHLFIW